MRAKARRILRTAVRLAQQEGSIASVGKGSGGRQSSGDIKRMIKVAVDIRKAADALQSSDLLHDLGDIQLAMMAASGKRRAHKRYTGLYREGSVATCFYILTGGSVREKSVSGVDRILTCERKPNSPFVLFGMEALLGRPRSSTLEALTDVDVIKFVAIDLNIREDGASKVARKVFDSFVTSELQSMPLFEGISNKQLKQVVPLLQLEEHSAGTVLFNMGNPGDKVFIVMHGAVSITKGKLLLQKLHAEQGQGATSALGLPVFGEMAIIDRRPRVTAATCDSDCKLLVLPHDQFAACMLIVPDIKARLRKIKEARRIQFEADERKRKEAEEKQAERTSGAGAPAGQPAPEGDDGLDAEM